MIHLIPLKFTQWVFPEVILRSPAYFSLSFGIRVYPLEFAQAAGFILPLISPLHG